ncbi:uncharacterized protein DUF550 [Raoultella ornithinolytica]|uniref:Uncharacterized protein DUF550 n=1 Tax=Raoultella ornithinolytica TaxID=54291 RepID=A0ABD7QNT3_RAOOR|nr:uncharacterized protein DUF550 [Raoultella ornithinolytica]
MTSKLTREENVQAVFDLKAGYTLGLADVEILKRVARMALAAMDSEPVAEVVSVFGDSEIIGERELKLLVGIQNMPYGTKFYRHAQPAPERDQVRREHAEWSQATFGNVGPIGPLKHLSKEALEAVAEPDDLSEWADMQFLLWDAQRRAGITDEQITQAMIEKLVVNKQREWPAPKDGEPRLHIKEQPAPVVPQDVLEALQKVARIRLDLNDFDGDRRGIADCLGDAEEALIEVVNRRAAMLAAAQQEVNPWSSHYLPVTRGDAVGCPFKREVKGE